MIRTLTLLLLLISTGLAATSIKVSEEYGYDPADATPFLRQALGPNSTADTIVVDNVGTWNVDRIFVRRDDVTILLEPGVIVSGLAGAFENANFKLFNVSGRTGIHFIGYGATIRMVPGVSFSSGDAGGFRHLLNFGGCTDVSVIGLTLRDSGGDGIQISKSFQEGEPSFTENVVIRDCFIDNNYRQGISITSGQNVLIENCLITNTEGALPSSGIDFEPSFAEERIVNCVVRNCRITDNAGRGIQNGFGKSDATTPPIDVLIEDTYIARNGTSNESSKAGAITLRLGQSTATGVVTVRNTLIEDQPYDGIQVQTKPGLVRLELDNVIIRNVANDQTEDFEHPITLDIDGQNPDLPFGGINFNNVVIEQDQDIEYFFAVGFFGDDQGMRTIEDITGNVTVISPFTPRASFVPDNPDGPNGNAVNVTLTATALTQWPATTLDVAAATPQIAEGEPGAFTFSLGTALAIPFPALYDVSGSADNRLDYTYAPGIRVLPTGVTTRDSPFESRVDADEEGQETITFSLDSSSPGTIGAGVRSGLAPQATILLGEAALPVTWGAVSVSHSADCNEVDVRWETSEESDVAGFDVESRSPSSGTWKTLRANIQPGNTSYVASFQRKLIVDGTAFRIRQNDFDGAFTYAPLVILDGAGCAGPAAPAMSVYPQPARDRLFIKIPWETPTTVALRDLAGRVLLSRSLSGGSAELSVADLPTGIYLLSAGAAMPPRRVVVVR